MYNAYINIIVIPFAPVYFHRQPEPVPRTQVLSYVNMFWCGLSNRQAATAQMHPVEKKRIHIYIYIYTIMYIYIYGYNMYIYI